MFSDVDHNSIMTDSLKINGISIYVFEKKKEITEIVASVSSIFTENDLVGLFAYRQSI